MVLGIETAASAAFLGTFGSFAVMGLVMLAFIMVILIFGRVGLMAGTPVTIAAFLLMRGLEPQITIPFGIVLGIIVGISFIKLYNSGR